MTILTNTGTCRCYNLVYSGFSIRGGVPGTFTHLKWQLVPPNLRVLHKIFLQNIQILRKSTVFK